MEEIKLGEKTALTVKEVSELYNIRVQSVYCMINQQKTLDAEKIGSQWLIPLTEKNKKRLSQITQNKIKYNQRMKVS